MNSSRIVILLFVAILFSLTGCLESSFQLSDDSRLPKWFVVPEGKNRNDFSVQMDLHSTFSGGKNVFKMYEKGTFFPIQEYTITSDMQPNIYCQQLKSPPKGFPKGYPCYIAITINGIADIIELRKMEPFFYVTDNPVIWREFGAKK